MNDQAQGNWSVPDWLAALALFLVAAVCCNASVRQFRFPAVLYGEHAGQPRCCLAVVAVLRSLAGSIVYNTADDVMHGNIRQSEMHHDCSEKHDDHDGVQVAGWWLPGRSLQTKLEEGGRRTQHGSPLRGIASPAFYAYKLEGAGVGHCTLSFYASSKVVLDRVADVSCLPGNGGARLVLAGLSNEVEIQGGVVWSSQVGHGSHSSWLVKGKEGTFVSDAPVILDERRPCRLRLQLKSDAKVLEAVIVVKPQYFVCGQGITLIQKNVNDENATSFMTLSTLLERDNAKMCLTTVHFMGDRLGFLEEGVGLLETFLKSHPNDIETRLMLARYLIDYYGDADSAWKEVTKAVATINSTPDPAKNIPWQYALVLQYEAYFLGNLAGIPLKSFPPGVRASVNPLAAGDKKVMLGRIIDDYETLFRLYPDRYKDATSIRAYLERVRQQRG